MLRDRGTIKWTAMMLTEHVELLREWHEEDKKQEPSTPSEQQYEQWNYILSQALESNEQVTIQYEWYNDVKRVEGFIQKIDMTSRDICLLDLQGQQHRIAFTSIYKLY